MEAAPRSQFYHYPANSYYPGATANSYYSPSFHQYPNYYANPYANHQRGPARPSLFNGFNTFNGFQDFQLPPNPLRFIYNQVKMNEILKNWDFSTISFIDLNDMSSIIKAFVISWLNNSQLIW